jgi:hypothetical protein
MHYNITFNTFLPLCRSQLRPLIFAMFSFKNCTIKAILLTNNQGSTSWGYKLVFRSAVNCWSAACTMINWRNHLLLVWFFHDELYMMKLITTLQLFNNHRFHTTFPQRPTNMLLIILRITTATSIVIQFSNLNPRSNCVTYQDGYKVMYSKLSKKDVYTLSHTLICMVVTLRGQINECT